MKELVYGIEPEVTSNRVDGDVIDTILEMLMSVQMMKLNLPNIKEDSFSSSTVVHIINVQAAQRVEARK